MVRLFEWEHALERALAHDLDAGSVAASGGLGGVSAPEWGRGLDSNYSSERVWGKA